MARFFRLHRGDFSYYSTSELVEDISEVGFGAHRIGAPLDDPMELQQGVDTLEMTLQHPDALRRSIIAYDVVIGAPKAVSVLWGLSDSTKAAVILGAHLESVGFALSYLQQTDFCREFDGKLHGGTMEGVMFVHGISRNADPHLHSHVVVANQSSFTKVGYRTIDQRRFLAALPMLEVVYRAALTDALKTKLGIELVGEQLGTLHIRGQNVALEGEFSSRRREVLRASEEFRSSPRARDLAAVRTRGAKAQRDLEVLRELWRARAEMVGVTELPKAHNVWYFRGRDLQRHHGIYISPIANEFHSEVAYQLLGGREASAATIIDRLISQRQGLSDDRSESTFGTRAHLGASEVAELARELPELTDVSRTQTPRQPRSWILGRSAAEDEFLEATGQGVVAWRSLDSRSILSVPSPPRLAISQLASLRDSRRMGEVRQLKALGTLRPGGEAADFLGRIDLGQGAELLIFDGVEDAQSFAVKRCVEELNANRLSSAPRGNAALVVGSRGLSYELRKVVRAHCDSVVAAGRAQGLALGEPIQVLHRNGVVHGTLRRGDDRALEIVDADGDVHGLPDVDLKYVRSMLIGVFENPLDGRPKYPRSTIVVHSAQRETLLMGVDAMAGMSPTLTPERVRWVLQDRAEGPDYISNQTSRGSVPLHVAQRAYREMVDVASLILLQQTSKDLFDYSESLLRSSRTIVDYELPRRSNDDRLGRGR